MPTRTGSPERAGSASSRSQERWEPGPPRACAEQHVASAARLRQLADTAARPVPRLHPVALVAHRAVRQVAGLPILKMFSTQDHDGKGTTNNLAEVPPRSPDEAWTAGTADEQPSGAGANAGWSRQHRSARCTTTASTRPTGAGATTTSRGRSPYRAEVREHRLRSHRTRRTEPSSRPVGAHTGWLGFAANIGRDQHWIAMGYPQGAPFAGGKIIMAASQYGYDDDWFPDAVLSVAMGSDLTGGSSGGPWILQYGLPGQVAGAGGNYINGHNDWKWNTEPEAMASPYFDCRPVAIYNVIGAPASPARNRSPTSVDSSRGPEGAPPPPNRRARGSRSERVLDHPASCSAELRQEPGNVLRRDLLDAYDGAASERSDGARLARWTGAGLRRWWRARRAATPKLPAAEDDRAMLEQHREVEAARRSRPSAERPLGRGRREACDPRISLVLVDERDVTAVRAAARWRSAVE